MQPDGPLRTDLELDDLGDNRPIGRVQGEAAMPPRCGRLVPSRQRRKLFHDRQFARPLAQQMAAIGNGISLGRCGHFIEKTFETKDAGLRSHRAHPRQWHAEVGRCQSDLLRRQGIGQIPRVGKAGFLDFFLGCAVAPLDAVIHDRGTSRRKGKRGRLALRVQGRRELDDGHWAEVAARSVFFAGPNQFDRLLDMARDLGSLDGIVDLRAATETTAHRGGVHRDLLARQAEKFRHHVADHRLVLRGDP